MRQAITTRYLGPTNTRGSRIKASAAAGSITIPYDYSGNSDSAHAKAAKALADKLGWSGLWVAGGLPDQRGNVYVNAAAAGSQMSECWRVGCNVTDDWFYIAAQEG